MTYKKFQTAIKLLDKCISNTRPSGYKEDLNKVFDFLLNNFSSPVSSTLNVKACINGVPVNTRMIQEIITYNTILNTVSREDLKLNIKAIPPVFDEIAFPLLAVRYLCLEMSDLSKIMHCEEFSEFHKRYSNIISLPNYVTFEETVKIINDLQRG